MGNLDNMQNLKTTASFLILGTLILTIFRTVKQAYFGPLAKIPGPWYARLTKLRLKAAVLTGCRAQYIDSLHKQYGPVVRVSSGEVSVGDPQAFKEIHAVGSLFLKSKWYIDLNCGPLDAPLGIFQMINPKDHAVRHRIFARGFSLSKLRDNWEDVVRERVRTALSRVRQDLETVGHSDILKWWILMTLDVSTHLMFGDSFHSLESGTKATYIHSIESLTFANTFLQELRPLYWLGTWIPLASFRSIFNARIDVYEQGAKAWEQTKVSRDAKNIFEVVSETLEAGESGLSNYDVAIEAGNLILAGSDTTANTLTYLIWSIITRPELRRLIEDEVAGVPLSDKEIEKLPILNAALEESLRLYSAVPGTLPRVSPRGGSTLCGYFIPEGTTVGTQAYTIHRDPQIFPNPDNFDYTRWLGPEEYVEEARKILHPFGAGARICIGIHLAKMELRLASAHFFQVCKGATVAPSTTPESMEMVNFFLMSPKSGKCEIMYGGSLA